MTHVAYPVSLSPTLPPAYLFRFLFSFGFSDDNSRFVYVTGGCLYLFCYMFSMILICD